MSWISDIGDWIGDNKSWLKPVAELGSGLFKQTQQNDQQSQYLDYLRQKEQQNYNDSVNAINAYNAQMAAASGYGGDNSAAIAAANQTDANQMRAARKANKVSQKAYKDILAMYAPYKATADRLLPQMTQTYENSLGLQNAMGKYIASPEQVAKLDAAGPAWNMNVPLPESLRYR